MADKMELVPGDKLVLMVQDVKNEMVGTGSDRARSTFTTPVDAFDKYTVFTGIDRLRELTGTAGRVSEINVVLKNRNSAGEAKKKIQRPPLPRRELTSSPGRRWRPASSVPS